MIDRPAAESRLYVGRLGAGRISYRPTLIYSLTGSSRHESDYSAMPGDLETDCGPETSFEAKIPDEPTATATVQLLKGFADETRLKILCLLRGQEVCVHEIVEALDVSQSAVSHQLRVLRDARLVVHRRDGRHVYYRLADAHVELMLDNALTHGEEVV